jgi:hypothetical protein
MERGLLMWLVSAYAASSVENNEVAALRCKLSKKNLRTGTGETSEVATRGVAGPGLLGVTLGLDYTYGQSRSWVMLDWGLPIFFLPFV